MFDISFLEMLIISIVALVVIGPERLPRVARTVGHLLGRARRYVDNVKNDIRHEIELDELKRLKESVHETTRSIEQSVRKEFDELRADVDMNKAENRSSLTVTEGTENKHAGGLSQSVSDSQRPSATLQQTPESTKNPPKS